MRLAASAIRARPSGLMERLPPLAFLAGLSAEPSAALLSAHRLRVASPILARPSALMRLFPPRAFLPGGLPGFLGACTAGPVMSRRASRAQIGRASCRERV